MKKRDLVKWLESNGFVLERNGASHDIYAKGAIKEPIPRHKEINQRLAEEIIKRNS